MVERKAELEKWGPYGRVKPDPGQPAQLPRHAGRAWRARARSTCGPKRPCQKIAEQYKDDPKAYKKKMKELESEAWEDFLDMTISQAILWAATNVQPEEKSSEIAAAEPYFIGSHSGASGAWVSGPEDLQTDETKCEYFWGYANMSTVKGLFCAGDASGASSHKFSSGSHAEGRIAAKAAIKFIVENNTMPKVDQAAVEALKAEILKPLDTFEQYKKATTDPDINPNYIKPTMFMFRLQKIMDEYAGGVTAQFTTNEALLEQGAGAAGLPEGRLREAGGRRPARTDALLGKHPPHVAGGSARAHVLFREETRWPGYYFRADKPSSTKRSGTSSPTAGAIRRPETGRC